MARRSERTVKVFEVLYDGREGGPAGDGTWIARFRSQGEAERFAASKTCYGQPATARGDDVPLRLAQRWGMA